MPLTTGLRELTLRQRCDRISQPLWTADGPPGSQQQYTVGAIDDAVAVGTSRWAWRGPAGEVLAMFGEYSEVTPPSRMVRTESFDMGCPSQGGQRIGTFVLDERAGVTTMTLMLVYPSKEARDATVASGMDQGMEAGYAWLDAMLAETSTNRA